MDGRVTPPRRVTPPPRRVTSPTWGPPAPSKQTLSSIEREWRFHLE